jgi:Putative auto-transporter adhesin, head GIN domain
MTTKLQYWIGLLCIGGILIAQTACDPLGTRGSGDLVTETRNETGFHAIKASIPGKMEVLVDSVYKVEVTCEENIIDYLDTKVVNGVLEINFDRNVYDVDKLKITVSAPSWDAFELSGSANIDVQNAINGSNLDLEISGSGDIDLFKAEFDKFNINISGSGNVALNGSGTDMECTVSGSGELEALDCPVKTADINVSGSGDVRLDVSTTLKVNISGSGTVEYKGDAEVTKNISGSGRVRKI